MQLKAKGILESYKKLKQDVLEDLTLTDIGNLVDDGVALDISMKRQDKIIKPIKSLLADYSKLKKERRHAGSQGIVEIGATSTSSIDPQDLLKFLAKINKKNLFMNLIKVNVTDAKKFLGEEALESILKIEKKEYNKVTFKFTKD